MDREEFERIKEEEKRHLRKLRDLKKQHRDASRRASTLKALQNMRRSDLEATHDEFTDKLSRESALQEARMELALEKDEVDDAGALTPEQKKAQRDAEAADLVRQMRQAMTGGDTGSAPSREDDASPRPSAPDTREKTLGRPAPGTSEAETPDRDRPDKTLGRPSS